MGARAALAISSVARAVPRSTPSAIPTRSQWSAQNHPLRAHGGDGSLSLGYCYCSQVSRRRWLSQRLRVSQPRQSRRWRGPSWPLPARVWPLPRARLSAPLQELIGFRTTFFIGERSFIGAMGDANSKLRDYHRQSQSVADETKQINDANSSQQNACAQPGSVVACPNPTYPNPISAPDLTSDVGKLRSVVSRLSSLKASVLAVTPASDLREVYAQLSQAIDQLSTDANYNADTLTKGVVKPDPNSQGSVGSVDDAQVATLHKEQALPAVRLMNTATVTVINGLQLPLTNYDVPGGTDADPLDHSVAQ